MKTLKTGLLAAVISAPGIVCAQQADTITTEKINKTLSDHETVVNEVNKDGVRVPIHTNRFKDNWFIGMGIGSSTFYGNYCTSANMGERTSFAVDIHAGKWFTPVMGLRLNAFLYTPKGYDINGENPLVNGNAGNGLYKTKWTAGMATAEMMVNVSNLTGGYKKDRFYNFIPYVGAGWVANLTAGNRSGAVMAAGFLNRFNINDSWALNLDLRANIFPESLDLTAMGGKWDQDMITSLMVGFSYRFRKSGWETCNISQSEIERVQKKITDMAENNRMLKDEKANKPKETKTVVSEYDEEGNRTPIHMNGFWDNWFIGAGIGSTTFVGNYTSGMPLKDRMSVVGNIHLGKWFTPTAGLRLNGYIYRPKGFDVNPNSPIVTGPAKNGMYHTKWTMSTVTAEMIVNATNLFFGYRNDRLYNCIPFIGAGWARNVSTKRPNDVVFSAGVLNRFYITDAWSLNIELRANLFDEEMDKTAGGGCKNDMLGTLMVGASYRFKSNGKRGWRTCSAQ